MYDIVKESNENFFIQTPSNPIRTHSQENPTKINEVQSQFLGEYEQAFSSIKEKCQKYLPNFEGKEIHYDQDKYTPFCYKIEEQLNNFEIVILKVWLGSFTTHLKILNIDINSPLSAFQSTAEGNFGQIYSFRFAGQNIAIKSFCVSNSQKSLKKSLKKIILEFCIFKICDALRCGPSVSNYFGFDILIFRDKIQFAMEKCQKCDFHDKYQEQLRENLGVLHRYKIMHMDINWNNIMYSPTYRKNIFIDFGFSEVIAEECGFKTYTSFKGTPQYISNQMLKLFKEDSFGFVDFYYNDLTGLSVTLKNSDSVRKMSTQQNDSLQGYQPDYQGLIIRKQIKEVNDYIQYVLILLKYQCYFNKNDIKTVLEVEDRILLQQHFKRVIQLFSKELSSFHSKEFVLSQFKELSKANQFKEYLQRLGKKEIKIAWETTDYQANQGHFYQKRFQESLLKTNQSSKDESREQFIESALKFLKQEPVLSDQQQKLRYFAIFFDLVRFDKSNLDLSVKQQISNDFLTFTKENAVLNSKDPLYSIKRAIKYLFHYCVCPPQTRWKQQRFFQLLLQCLFLEIDFSEGLSAIQGKMVANCYDCKQLISILYEYCLINSIFEMKHKFQNFQLGKRLISQTKKDSRAIALFIIENYGKSEVKQQKSAAQIIAWQLKLKDNPSRQYQSYESFLSGIKDQKLQIDLIKISLMIELQNSEKLSDFSLWTKVIEKIKSALFCNIRVNLNSFKDRLVWNYQLSSQDNLQQSCKRYIQQVKNIINCPQIYDSLVFKFKFCKQNAAKETNFLKNSCFQLIICCFQQKRFDIYSFLFSDMITVLSSYSLFREQNMDLLVELSQKYIDSLQQHLTTRFQGSDHQKQNKESRQKEQQFSSYLNLHVYQGFLYKFLLQCGQPMKESISRYEKLIKHRLWNAREMKAIFNQTSFKKHQFVSFYYYNMLRYQAFHERNLQKIYKHQREIFKMNSAQIPQYILKSIVFLMLALQQFQTNQQKQQINNLVIWSWKYHEVNGYMKAYFIESYKRPEIIKDVLQILYLSTQKKDRYHHSSWVIAEPLLYQHFYQQYNFILQNLSLFFDYSIFKIKLQPLNWSNRYQILCFSLALLLSRKDQQIKQLLKIIAKNIRYVKWNCQQIVLNHYFETIFNRWAFTQFKKRKNIFLIKFLATKILLRLYDYHKSKMKMLLGLIGLHKKQHNFFKKKLKEKILKWNYEKIRPE